MTAARPARRAATVRPESGSAVVDFVLVAGLLTLLFVAVLQLALVVHVRNVLVDSAAEGARYAARADRVPADGIQRARDLASSGVSPRFARDVTAGEEDVGGVRTVVVRIRAPLPVIGLIGPRGRLDVSGHAFAEVQP